MLISCPPISSFGFVRETVLRRAADAVKACLCSAGIRVHNLLEGTSDRWILVAECRTGPEGYDAAERRSPSVAFSQEGRSVERAVRTAIMSSDWNRPVPQCLLVLWSGRVNIEATREIHCNFNVVVRPVEANAQDQQRRF